MKKGMEWERRLELLSILELLSSRSLGRGSIDRSIDRETEGSLNGGHRFEIIGVVELTGISPIQGPRVATARWVTNWTGSTTFSDYLRVTLSLKLANLQFPAPVERLKWRGRRGEMFRISRNFNRVTVFEIESFTKKLAIVRTID